MEFNITRQIIHCAWRGEEQFDPLVFRRRLARARVVRGHAKFEKLAQTRREMLFMVDDSWMVFLDLSGRDAHYCTCPNGARKVTIVYLGGSLCEHVLACALLDGKAYLLIVHFHLLAKAVEARAWGSL